MQLDLIARRAELTPQRPALQFRGRWYSFAELELRAQRLAARLHQFGVVRGDRVAIMAFNHLAHVDLVLAAPKLGFIYTPFNYRLSAREQTELAAYIAPKLMLYDERNEALAHATGCRLRRLEKYESWLAATTAPAPPAPALDAEDVAMILFTGGSTGLPKGAMLAYRQLFFNAVNTAFSWDVGAGDCTIQATPAFHAAFNVFTTPLLHAGGRTILMESFDPGEYLRLVAQEGVTLMFMVPTMFQMLVEHPDFDRADLSSVRWAISGGAPCPAPLQARFAARGIRFKQGFGMTEAGVNCFAVDVDAAAAHPGTVGKPMLHAEAVIRDAQGVAVARGATGELTLRGPHLFLGYWQRPEETAKAFRDGWLWTGDLARQDDDGFFHIVGRTKEMYISGGENIYPVEIESLIYAQPEVAECAVLGVPHQRWGECGLAAIALRPGHYLSADELHERLKSRLARYKLPRHFLFLDALPKSGAGKIAKPEIRRLFDQRKQPPAAKS